MKKDETVVPLVHLNGTGRSNLVEMYSDASYALSEAIRKVADAAPNGRDYYVIGNFQQAVEQHQLRIDRLIEIREEIEYILNCVAE